MQARYYDPVIGRFYSNDPIGARDVHSFNRYAYVRNNPYKYTDPTGMKEDWIFENKRRHERAVRELAKKLRKQGYKVKTEVRVKVEDEDGDSSIRVLDIVATDGDGDTTFIEVKTFASKKESTLQKLSNKHPINKAIKATKLAVRGSLWYRQMVKDARINEAGGVYQKTGEKFGPQPVFWHGFEQKKGGQFKAIPPFKIE